MQRTRSTHALVLATAAALALGATACGGDDNQDLPAGVAAIVGKTKIPAASIDRVSDKFTEVKPVLLSRLIQERWIADEVRARNISVSKAQLNNRLRATFQVGVAQRNPAVLREARREATRAGLAESLLGRPFAITEGQIQRFYASHKERYFIQESRHIAVVTTGTKADALQARSALERGVTWKAAGKKYVAPDQGPVADQGDHGYTYVGIVEGEGSPGFNKAVFAADKGELVGPVLRNSEWTVFAVGSISPAVQQTLEQARAAVVISLRAGHRKRAYDQMYTALRAKYRDRTTCGSELRVPECDNASGTSRGRYIP